MSSNLEVKECCLEEWIHPELSLKVGADVIPVCNFDGAWWGHCVPSTWHQVG